MKINQDNSVNIKSHDSAFIHLSCHLIFTVQFKAIFFVLYETFFSDYIAQEL